MRITGQPMSTAPYLDIWSRSTESCTVISTAHDMIHLRVTPSISARTIWCRRSARCATAAWWRFRQRRSTGSPSIRDRPRAVKKIFELKRRAAGSTAAVDCERCRAGRRPRRHADAAGRAPRLARLARAADADHSGVAAFVRRRASVDGQSGGSRAGRRGGARARAQCRPRDHVYERQYLRRSASGDARCASSRRSAAASTC